MTNKVQLIVYPVKDVEQAKKFYTAYLGTEPYADSPYYVGYKLGELEVGLDPNGKAVISYIDVPDIKASLKTLTAVGAKVTMEPKDVGGGLQIAQVLLEGNTLGLRQHAK